MKGQWGKLAGYIVGTGAVATAITLLPARIGIDGNGWLPDLISSEGGAIDDLFWGLTIMSLVIFAIVCGIVVYSMVHFRAAPGDLGDGEHIHGNAKMEVAWIVIPSIIVLVIGVLSYVVLQDNEVGLYDKAAAKKPGAAEMVVDVRGFSFGWAFRYETKEGEPLSGDEDAVPSSELVLPVDKVVRFNVLSCSGKEHLGRIQEQVSRELAAGDEADEFAEIEPGICEREWDLTTDEDQKAAEEDATRTYEALMKRQDGKQINDEEQAVLDEQPRFHGDQQFIDVNHAFWVPEARLKIDAISGLRTYVQWEPNHVTGPDDNYQVVCAELCGTGHNGMRTDMCVVDQETFDWWAKLDEEARRDATCTNLRLLTCLGGDVDDRDDAIADVAKLSKEDPDAACDAVKEKI
ncbi:MAG: cytochrome c oxidase, subunit [Thermoleophilia bacterium]|nr:cytochrome c oxidase, subunit [Thermoleophilia bacterium]